MTDIDLKELKFTAKEVVSALGRAGATLSLEPMPEVLSRGLNAILAEKLAGAQQVWKTEFDVRPAWTEFQRGTEKKTARLVMIEEIKK